MAYDYKSTFLHEEIYAIFQKYSLVTLLCNIMMSILGWKMMYNDVEFPRKLRIRLTVPHSRRSIDH